MKKIIAFSCTIAVLFVVLTFAKADALPPEQGGCWLTGIGTIGCPGEGQRDTFGGNAMTMKNAAVRGQWTHIAVDSEIIFQGDVHYLVCKAFLLLSGPGVPEAYPNYANFGGTGKLNGIDGYYFDVKAFDHGEPGIYFDRYVIDIYDSNKNLVYHADGQRTRECHECLDDSLATGDLAWVLDFGCISGGDFQIDAPNGGHPF